MRRAADEKRKPARQATDMNKRISDNFEALVTHAPAKDYKAVSLEHENEHLAQIINMQIKLNDPDIPSRATIIKQMLALRDKFGHQTKKFAIALDETLDKELIGYDRKYSNDGDYDDPTPNKGKDADRKQRLIDQQRTVDQTRTSSLEAQITDSQNKDSNIDETCGSLRDGRYLEGILPKHRQATENNTRLINEAKQWEYGLSTAETTAAGEGNRMDSSTQTSVTCRPAIIDYRKVLRAHKAELHLLEEQIRLAKEKKAQETQQMLLVKDIDQDNLDKIWSLLKAAPDKFGGESSQKQG